MKISDRTRERLICRFSFLFRKAGIPMGDLELTARTSGDTLEELFSYLNDRSLRFDYEFRIVPGSRKIKEIESLLKELEELINLALEQHAKALGLQETWLYIVFSKIFKDYPVAFSRLMRFQKKINGISAQTLIEVLRQVRIPFIRKPGFSQYPCEPGERFIDRVVVSFIGVWVALGLQVPISQKLGSIFLSNGVIVNGCSLVLGYVVAWCFYEVAKQSLVNHFVEQDEHKKKHWSDWVWVLGPVVVEQAFLLSTTIQSIGYAPAVPPFVAWVSAIVGSAFGSTTLVFYARGLAKSVREYREARIKYLKEELPRQRQLYEEKVAQTEARRDVMLEEEHENTRVGVQQIRESASKLKKRNQDRKLLLAELKRRIKNQIDIEHNWRRDMELKKIDIKYADMQHLKMLPQSINNGLKQPR